MKRRMSLSTLPVLAVLALAGCSRPPPDGGFVSAQPSTNPAKPITPFTSALSCLDTMLRTLPNVFRQTLGPMSFKALTVGLIPDATGRLDPGLRDMITSAAFNATSRSQRFVLVEANMVAGPGGLPPGANAAAGGGLVLGPSGGGSPQKTSNAGFVGDSIQIVGSITQADKTIQQNNGSFGVSVNNSTISAAQNFDFGAVVLDLRLVDIAHGGVVLQSAKNGLVVRNDGKSLNADLKLGSFGVSFEYSSSTAEGPHQAVSTLVDLSVVELLGREAGVPYWQCLAIDRTNPAIRAQARHWFEGMGEGERDSYVRQRLSALGYGVPAAPGSMEDALIAFQNNNELTPLGRITFDTFAALIAGARPVDAGNGQKLAKLPPATPASPRSVAITVRESVADHTLWLDVNLDRAGYLTCYYRDEHARILRLYPNKYQPTMGIRSDLPAQIPPAGGQAPFNIKPDAMTPDLGFLCLATGRDVSVELPAALQAEGFQEVRASDFDTIISAYRKLAGDDLAVRATTRGKPGGRWNAM